MFLLLTPLSFLSMRITLAAVTVLGKLLQIDRNTDRNTDKSLNIPGYYLYPPKGRISCCAALLNTVLGDFHQGKLYYNGGEKQHRRSCSKNSKRQYDIQTELHLF